MRGYVLVCEALFQLIQVMFSTSVIHQLLQLKWFSFQRTPSKANCEKGNILTKLEMKKHWDNHNVTVWGSILQQQYCMG